MKRPVGPTPSRLSPDADGFTVMTANALRLFEHFFAVFNRLTTADPFRPPAIDPNELPHHCAEFLGTSFARHLNQQIERAERRYAFRVLNVDETLVVFSINACARQYAVLDDSLAAMPGTDGVDGTLLYHFLECALFNVGHNIAFKVLDYRYSHHLMESFFKAAALTLNELLGAPIERDPTSLKLILEKGA